MDIATLGLEIRSDQVKQATLDLRALPEAASAAERAAEKLRITTTAAGASSEEFSRRVLRNIDALKFQADQLSRSSAEQERFTALRRAGVTAESAAGQAITTSVTALQAQRQAAQAAAEAGREQAAAARLTEENNRRAASAVQSVVSALDFEMAQLGRTTAQRAQYEAVRRAGVAADSAEGKAIMSKVAALETERVALRNLEAAQLAAARGPAGSAGLTAQQRLMLGYQFNDIFTQLASGSNPMMIAAQQGPQITQVFGGIGATLAAIPKSLLIGGAAALGIGALTAAVVALKDLNDTLETHKRRIGDVIGDQRLSADAYGEIRRQASAAGEEIEKTSAKYEKFARSGVFVGATGAQVGSLVGTINQIGRMGGATAEEQTATTDALAKALRESVVSAANLDTILENMPSLGRRIADGLGLSVVQLRLMANQGDLTNKQVFDAILSQQDKVSAKFKETGITVGGFFSEMLRTVGDIAVGIYKIGVNIELVSSKAEAARRMAAAQPNRVAPATPRVIGASGSNLTLDEMISFGEAGQTDSAVLNGPGRLTNQFLDLQRAATAAAGEAVLSADKIADKLIQNSREIDQQIETVTKGLDALQSGFADLDATKAAAETRRLSDALQFLRDRAAEAKTAYGQALEAVQTRQLQNDIGMTPGQRATDARVRQFMDSQPGVTREAAQTVVDAGQLQMLDDMIAKQQQELAVQSAITIAMRNGKAAADDAAVAMQVLGISIEQLGTITPEAQVKLDILAETLGKIREQARAQSGIDASKPLITELAGIAAAMKSVELGAYAMKRAEAEAKAARDENGTGALQMQVFDARQALTDATALQGLDQQIKLTNDLAAAAGDVVRQKQIQLDYDIKIAQQAAGPGAQTALAERMKAKAVADTNRELREGTADLARQVDVAQQQLGIIRSGAPDQAAQIAMLQKRNELLAKGVDLAGDEAQKQVAMAGTKARLDEQLGYEKEAADATKRTWMNAYDNIQSFGADSFYGIMTGATVDGKSAAETLKNIFFRAFAEIAAAAIIRPVIAPIFQAASGLGLIPGGVVPSATGSTSSGLFGGGGSGGLSVGGFGGGTFNFGGVGGGMFSGVRDWLNTPIFQNIDSEIANWSTYGTAAQNSGAGFLGLGGMTGGNLLGGAIGIGSGIYQLASGKGSTASTIGGIGSMVGGVMSMIPGLQPIGMGISLLSSILPGLIGGGGDQRPPMPALDYSMGAFYGNAGGAYNYVGGSLNGGNSMVGTGRSLGGSTLSLFRQAGLKVVPGSLYGGELASGVDHGWNGQNWQGNPYTQTALTLPGGGIERLSYMDSSRDPQAAADYLLTQVFKANVLRGGVSGATPTLKTSLQNLDPSTGQDLQNLISNVKAYDQLGKTITQTQKSVDQITSSFEQLSDWATSAGLSLDPVNKAMQDQIEDVAKSFKHTIDATLDPVGTAMADFVEQRKADADELAYINDNIKSVTISAADFQAYQAKKEAALKEQLLGGSIDSLQAAIAAMTTGSLANLSPEAQLSGLRGTYNADLALSRSGDYAAIARIAGEGTDLLGAYRQSYGSGPQYQAALEGIRSDLIQISAQVQQPSAGGTELPALNQANQSNVMQITQLTATVAAMAQQQAKLLDTVKGLTAELARTRVNRAA